MSGQRIIAAADDGERVQRGTAVAKQIAKRIQRKSTDAAPASDKKTARRKDKSWDERLRLTGDARFTEVTWSGRDHPSWPLPRK
jgi:hypothetical protein